MIDTREKAVLCYGDSNTWGYVPLTGARLPRAERWPGILQNLLGEPYYVIEEGMNGRSTAWDEPFRDGRNARTTLLSTLESHAPLTLVILMLGTNDLKHHLNVSAHESSRGIAALMQIIQKSGTGPDKSPPRVLVVAPPQFGKLSELMTHHFDGSVEKSADLPRYYGQACVELGCNFFNTNDVVTVGVDGIHLNSAGHRKLAETLAPIVRELVKDTA
jgi:lysophospholipase L1-like esterase